MVKAGLLESQCPEAENVSLQENKMKPASDE